MLHSNLTFNIAMDVPLIVIHANTKRAVGEIDIVSPHEFEGDHATIEVQAFHEDRRILEQASLCRNGGDTIKKLDLIALDVSLRFGDFHFRIIAVIPDRLRLTLKTAR
jgi:hypothetical protein